MSILNEDSALPIGNDNQTPIEFEERINQAKQKKAELKQLKRQIDRWQKLDLGLLQAVLKCWYKNVSKKTAIVFAISSNILFSLFDTVSDLSVAYYLFASGERELGFVVIIVDYLPGWELLIHNLCCKKWRRMPGARLKFITILCLLISPFSCPLFFLQWLMKFNSTNSDTFDYLHHNARLSQLLMGSLESPLQMTMLLVLYAENKLPSPFMGEGTQITDLNGNIVNFGNFFGILSFIISFIVILKGSLEIAESKSLGEIVSVCGYALCNFVFRLGSFALAIIYFKPWSMILFVTIAIINVTCIIQHDAPNRKMFSFVTSAMISMFAPFMSSEQPHRFQLVDNQENESDIKERARKRRNLSSKMALWTTPVILICDLVLLCLLQYYPHFKYSKAIVLPKSTTIKLLILLIFPIGTATIIAAISFRKQKHISIDYFNTNQIIDLNIDWILRTVRSIFRYSGIILSIMVMVLTIMTAGIQFIAIESPRNGKCNQFIIAETLFRQNTKNYFSFQIKLHFMLLDLRFRCLLYQSCKQTLC